MIHRRWLDAMGWLEDRSATIPRMLLLVILVGCWLTNSRPQDLWASAMMEVTEVLDVTQEPGGGVRATARVLFPAKTEVIQRLLTDYPRWPELFEVRMRLAELKVLDGVATVDLRIEHALIPGERRLVTESRTLSGGGLVTDLRGGDFKRYHRVWRLRSTGEGNQTQADFDLVFELDSLVPDWMVALAVRQELEAHFRIVKQKALEQSRP